MDKRPLSTKDKVNKNRHAHTLYQEDALKMLPPFGVTSFDQLDALEEAVEVTNIIKETFHKFVMMGDHILFDNIIEPELILPTMKELTGEFINRLEVAPEQMEKSTDTSIMDVTTSGTVSLFKGINGVTYWAGIPTNKFEDRDDPPDILSEEGHLHFVKELDDAIIPYPDLYIWHIPKSVGKATWVAYDERGFLVAGGTVHKEFDELVTSFLKNATEPIGMSHGMKKNTITRDPLCKNIIRRYRSFEFSFLPQNQAANKLTAFGTY